MEYQYNYDVKEEFIKLLQKKGEFDGAKELGYYLDKYQKEKSKIKRNLIKFCMYKLSVDLLDQELSKFDCDVSKYVIESFSGTYKWLENAVCQNQKDWNGKPINVKYELLKDDMIFRGDTMTSIWTVLKGYLKLKNGISEISENDTWESFFLRECDKLKLSNQAGNFLQLGHSIGNFLPVPPGFNVGRSNFGKWDSWDLTLSQIYEWYLENSYQHNSKALERLFINDKNKDTTVLNCEKWLLDFGTWDNFIKENCLTAFVDKKGIPKKFFKSHTLDNPLPRTLGEYEEFFATVNECIEIRGKEIVRKLEGDDTTLQKQKKISNILKKMERVYPFSIFQKGIRELKEEINKKTIESISYFICYIMRTLGILACAVYYIQFLVKVGYNPEFSREHRFYIPSNRYGENLEELMLGLFILTVLLLCISYIKKNKKVKKIVMTLITIFIVILCVVPIVYTVTINTIQYSEWFLNWLNSDYTGHVEIIDFYIRLYGIICGVFALIPSIWLLIDSFYRNYMKYCLKTALITIVMPPILLMILETGTLLIMSGIIIGYILIRGWRKRCPYCGKLFALRKTQVELVAQEDISVAVDVDTRDEYGKTIRTTTQYVPGTRDIYDIYYVCKHCGSEIVKRGQHEYAKI